jgi:hypothetical protein
MAELTTDVRDAVPRANAAAAGIENAEFLKGYLALTETEFGVALSEVGLGKIEICATHRVHAHATSAIVRARKPAA